MVHELTPGGYLLSDDAGRLQPEAVHAYLRCSYWAAQRSRETVETSLQHSLCIGIYAADGTQVGLVRVVTDRATYAYLCDVYVLEEHRGRGLAKAALRAALDHPYLKGIRRVTLLTRDAHSFYTHAGFAPPLHPEFIMDRRLPTPPPAS